MKGFVFLYGSEVLLRFVHTGAFRELEVKHDITYIALASSSLMKDGGVGSNLVSILPRVVWVPFFKERFNRWVELFDISCIRFQDLSASFKIRYEETSLNAPERVGRLKEFAQPSVYETHRKAVEQEMGLNPAILSLTLDRRPDFFVLPSALLDYLTDDVLQIAATLSIPTALLVSGWDSLSSKGLIYHHPTRMGVWGEQSRDHAIQIQGVIPASIQIIGAPHYENFKRDPGFDRKLWRQGLNLPLDRPVIMLAGSYRTFDETALLRTLDDAISTGSLPPVHIFYRPHPWRATRNFESNYFSQSWRNISMDPEMVGTYKAVKEGYGDNSADNFLFRLKHLIQIYRSVDGVVSPMSTVLLEALMFNLPILAIAFGDGKHSWSADKASRMHHFNDFFSHPALRICRDQEFFHQVFRSYILNLHKTASIDMEKYIQHFVYRDHRSYSTRVSELIDQMTESITEKPAYDALLVRGGRTYEPAGFVRVLRTLKKMTWMFWRKIKYYKSVLMTSPQ